ncbi:MAG TPA: PHP domain-containing protein [Planctomycetota bacterium]|jgi:DNA polymerase (family 10)
MEPLDAAAVARLLTEIAQRLELAGEMPYSIRAYHNAAHSVLGLNVPLAEVVAKGKLREIPGVGEAIAEKIIKLHKTGTHPTLEHLREQMPSGVLDLLQVPGLGPKKVALLYTELKVSSLEELEEACKTGKLKPIKGLGSALQSHCLEAIEKMRQRVGQQRLNEAASDMQAVRNYLQQQNPGWVRVEFAGTLRRACELVTDFTLVAEGDSRRVEKHEAVRINVSDASHFGVTLLFATGSAEHVSALQAYAAAKDLKLTADGLWRQKSGVAPASVPAGEEILCREERDVYAALGLPYIEPELREGRPLFGAKNEVEAAAAGNLPALIRDADLRGVLHCHSSFSDGHETLHGMAEAARKLGYHYFGIADHSKSAFYAGGLKEETIREQHKQVDKLNAEYAAQDFRVFKGIESDILQDGALDYSDDVLQSFDFVVASIHSRFGLGKEAQTQRLIAAASNPRTTILGHPSGRLLLQRDAYDIDLDAVLQACAKNGVVVEINAHPQRLDLDWRWHQRALELGCMLAINPDAHSRAELEVVHWGVLMARKGAVPRGRILNCMELPAIAEFFAKRKARS